MGSSLQVAIVGFVGSKPEVRTVTTSDGQQEVASFSVAINRKTVAGEQQTLWVRVSCWRRLAAVATTYLDKGSLVQVTTDWLKSSSWLDQDGNPQSGVEITASRLILLDRNQGRPEDDQEDIAF